MIVRCLTCALSQGGAFQASALQYCRAVCSDQPVRAAHWKEPAHLSMTVIKEGMWEGLIVRCLTRATQLGRRLSSLSTVLQSCLLGSASPGCPLEETRPPIDDCHLGGYVGRNDCVLLNLCTQPGRRLSGLSTAVLQSCLLGSASPSCPLEVICPPMIVRCSTYHTQSGQCRSGLSIVFLQRRLLRPASLVLQQMHLLLFNNYSLWTPTPIYQIYYATHDY